MIFAEIDREAFRTMPFVLNTIGSFEKQPPMCLPAGAAFHEFLWVTEGVGDFTVGGESFSLSAGQGIFLRAGTPHSYRGSAFSTAWCTFVGGDGLLDYAGIKAYYTFPVPSFLSEEADALYRFAVGDSNVISRAAAAFHLVSELLLATAAQDATLSAKARAYLEQHYADAVTLDDVALFLGTDRFSLCHIYQREKGCSVMEDLYRIRVEKAKRFLRFSSDSISRIGRMCGFSDASYFAHRFRLACGCTPREYRSKISAPQKSENM